MAWLRDDLRVALRRCRHQPAFTIVVILTLALGLGANTAVFTLVDALMLRSLVVGGPVLETVVGLAIGLPLAMLVGRAIGSQLYGLGGQNPTVWGITIGILVLTSILAAAIPALRAASIDPSRALRGE